RQFPLRFPIVDGITSKLARGSIKNGQTVGVPGCRVDDPKDPQVVLIEREVPHGCSLTEFGEAAQRNPQQYLPPTACDFFKVVATGDPKPVAAVFAGRFDVIAAQA